MGCHRDHCVECRSGRGGFLGARPLGYRHRPDRAVEIALRLAREERLLHGTAKRELVIRVHLVGVGLEIDLRRVDIVIGKHAIDDILMDGAHRFRLFEAHLVLRPTIERAELVDSRLHRVHVGTHQVRPVPVRGRILARQDDLRFQGAFLLCPQLARGVLADLDAVGTKKALDSVIGHTAHPVVRRRPERLFAQLLERLLGSRALRIGIRTGLQLKVRKDLRGASLVPLRCLTAFGIIEPEVDICLRLRKFGTGAPEIGNALRDRKPARRHVRRAETGTGSFGGRDLVGLINLNARHQADFILLYCEAPPSAVEAMSNAPLTRAPFAANRDALALDR